MRVMPPTRSTCILPGTFQENSSVWTAGLWSIQGEQRLGFYFMKEQLQKQKNVFKYGTSTPGLFKTMESKLLWWVDYHKLYNYFFMRKSDFGLCLTLSHTFQCVSFWIALHTAGTEGPLECPKTLNFLGPAIKAKTTKNKNKDPPPKKKTKKTKKPTKS